MSAESRPLAYWQALNEALALEMRRDPRVVVLGEDVAGGAGREEAGIVDAWGGPYGVTRGLIQEFGPERVRDTPISEAAFIGAAVGLAVEGWRPWVDLMFTHFAGVAWDQLVNKLARQTYLTAGQAALPVTIKTFGSCYGPFLHFPGLICVAPSDPYTAKGLMTSAIREDNPVVCFDSTRLVRARTHVPEEQYSIPIGRARIARQGDDLTLVGVSTSVAECLAAAERLAQQGVSAEVIDLLTLAPWDRETVQESAARTRRVAIVDHDHPHCGLARDIAAELAEELWDRLEAPPVCVTPPHVPLPTEDGNPALLARYWPDASTIVSAVEERLLAAGTSEGR